MVYHLSTDRLTQFQNTEKFGLKPCKRWPWRLIQGTFNKDNFNSIHLRSFIDFVAWPLHMIPLNTGSTLRVLHGKNGIAFMQGLCLPVPVSTCMVQRTCSFKHGRNELLPCITLGRCCKNELRFFRTIGIYKSWTTLHVHDADQRYTAISFFGKNF